MKKTLTIVAAILAAFTVNAQDIFPKQEMHIDIRVFDICAQVLVLVLFMIFILTILKRILEYRVKNKIVEKGVPENIVSSILQTNAPESRHINIKWFALLAGIGAGLTIVNYTLPLGFHSLAIMSFSIALSFLGYYFFLRKAGN
jgi:hypothetical protein